MKKILLVIFVVLLVSVTAVASDEILIGSPIVDGVLDDLYLESYSLTVTGTDHTFHTSKKRSKPDGSFGDSATGYYLYDEDTLYVCIVVKDDKVFSRGKDWVAKYIADLSWENDAVEARIYYPELGTPIQANQYIFQCDAMAYGTTNYRQLCKDSHIAATSINKDGFVVEFAIPLSFNKKAGDKVGVSIEIDDLHEHIDDVNSPMNAYNFNAYGSQHPYRNMIKLSKTKATEKPSLFDDVIDHQARDDISYVVHAGIFNGTDKGFEPDTTMTRAMFATIIGRLHEMKKGKLDTFVDAPKFKDVDYDSWYGKYLDWASGSGIINGVGDSRFNPNAPVTKQEMAVILYRYLNITDSETSISFADANDVASWAKSAVGYCAKNGFITSDESNKFYPASYAKRHEAASLIAKYIPTVTAPLYD